MEHGWNLEQTGYGHQPFELQCAMQIQGRHDRGQPTFGPRISTSAEH